MILMTRIRCKMWTCPYCAKENRKEWGNFLRKRLPKVAAQWWFITLTAHERFRDEAKSLANIRGNIDRIFKRLRRIYSNVEYVRVYEVHKTGAFHAHLLVTGLSARLQKHTARNGVEFFRATLLERGVGNWSVRTWFRRTARQMGMGYMVDVQEMADLRQTVGYIVKYLTKEAQAYHVPGLRRIQTTTGIGSPRQRGDGTWTSAPSVLRENVPEGTTLYDLNKRVRVDNQYWREHREYPRPE